MSLDQAVAELLQTNPSGWRGTPYELFDELNATGAFFGWNEDPQWPKDPDALLLRLTKVRERLEAERQIRVERWHEQNEVSVRSIPRQQEGTIFEWPTESNSTATSSSVDDEAGDMYTLPWLNPSNTPQTNKPIENVVKDGNIKLESSSHPGNTGATPPPTPIPSEEEPDPLEGVSPRQRRVFLSQKNRTCETCGHFVPRGQCWHPAGDRRIIMPNPLVICFEMFEYSIRLWCPFWEKRDTQNY